MLKDEEIAEQKYQERRKRYSGIETGIYSGDEFIEFSETCLFVQCVESQDCETARYKMKSFLSNPDKPGAGM